MRSLRGFKAENAGESKVADASKYDGMSESRLMSELLKNVAKAKSDGSFSAEQLDDFVAFVSPNLDESSKARLKELADMIKGR